MQRPKVVHPVVCCLHPFIKNKDGNKPNECRTSTMNRVCWWFGQNPGTQLRSSSVLSGIMKKSRTGPTAAHHALVTRRHSRPPQPVAFQPAPNLPTIPGTQASGCCRRSDTVSAAHFLSIKSNRQKNLGVHTHSDRIDQTIRPLQGNQKGQERLSARCSWAKDFVHTLCCTHAPAPRQPSFVVRCPGQY